eukprot:5093634-Prymnesium_polylepis.1
MTRRGGATGSDALGSGARAKMWHARAAARNAAVPARAGGSRARRGGGELIAASEAGRGERAAAGSPCARRHARACGEGGDG